MHNSLKAFVLSLLCTVSSVSAAMADAKINEPLRKLGAYGGKLLVDPGADTLGVLRRGEQTLHLNDVLLADGSTKDFQTRRFDVFAPDAQIVAFDGSTSVALSPPEVIAYIGTAVDDPEQSIYISVTNGEQLWMLVNGGKGTNSFLAPEKASDGSLRHLLAPVTTEDLEGFACGIESLAQAGEALDHFYEPDGKTAGEKATATTLEAELLLDIGNALLNQRFDGNQNTAKNYVANLVGAVSSIYKRDLNTVLTIKQLVVWTSSDPFGTGSSTDQLTKYRSYNLSNRGSTSRDLAHLLSTKSRLDGIAYVGVLCNGNYGYGVTNLGGNANFSVSSYQWDIYAFAHEIGHNFGSPHTHCYSPPIDCCYASESDCDQCSTAVAETGTLMSYCHLNGSVNMSFHNRTVNVMRSAAENAACITAYVPSLAPEIAIKGNGIEISAGDQTASYTDGTNFGSTGLDGEEMIRTFKLVNTGTADLLLTGSPAVLVSGISSADFTVINMPASTVAPGAQTQFQVRFRASSPSLRLASISVPNNDGNEADYSFVVEGHGVPGEGPRTVSYTGPSVAVPDNNPAGILIPLNVSGVTGALTDVNFRFDGSDCSSAVDATGVGVQHPYIGDLTFSLAAPDGTSMTLMSRRGGSGDNICQAVFDDNGGGASISGISALGVPPGGPPYSGTHLPEQPLGIFNGHEANGTWLLHVTDSAAADVGAVLKFSLVLSGAVPPVPAAPNAAVTWGTGALQNPRYASKTASSGLTSYRVQGTAHVSNLGTIATDKATSVTFHLSSDAVLDRTDLLIARKKVRKVQPTSGGKPLKTRKVALKKKISLNPAGRYLIATVHANGDIEPVNNFAVSGPLP